MKPQSIQIADQKISDDAIGAGADFDRLGGGSNFDFVTSHAPDAGKPFVESDKQKVLRGISWILGKAAPLSPRQEVSGGAGVISDFLQWVANNTDDNKLMQIRDNANKSYETSKQRQEESGGSIPEYDRDLAVARETKRIVDTIISPRIDISNKFSKIDDIFKAFQERNPQFDMLPGPNSPSYDELKVALRNRTITQEDLDRVSADLRNAIAKPENAPYVSGLEKLYASFTDTGAKMGDELASINRLSEQSRTAWHQIVEEYSSPADESKKNTIQLSDSGTVIGQSATENKAARTQSDLQNWSTAAAFVPGGDSNAKPLVAAGSKKLIQDQKDAMDGLTKSSRTYTEQTKLGTQSSAQSAAATDNVKSKVVTLKQSQDELQKSCAVQLAQMPQLTKAANDQADAYRRVADAQTLQKLAGDIQFQQDQMGRSTIDQTVASTQKQYGLPVDMNSASANIIRYNEQLKYARELAGDFASTLVSGLRNGEGLWKSLGKAAISVLTKISDRLLNDVLNSLFKVNSAAAGGGLLGGGGILGGLFGGGGGLDLGILARSPQAAAAVASGIPGLWADGGYTGPGGKNEPAGIVHAGEVVWSQKDIARAGGVGVVEAMRLGRRGYADGGVVGEGGPQLLRAQPDAAVPVRRLRADNQNDASGSASGVHVTVGVSVDEDGNLKAYVKNVAQSEAQSSTRQGLNDFNQQLPDRVAQINRNPRRR
ncbi:MULTISPECIES: hypothetical protein [unclassified Rhizobium]|uniref:hypothetical protein n=1 Tax=unclassified Rhizobium TaxID=2613769 RepID=UPI0019698985|nr:MULTISPECIES: hypothetical protein [unclassified Rhizobium]